MMKSRLRAYIHIGTHKTGTTALQSWAYINSDNLLDIYSIYYPKVFSTGDGHHALARSISSEIKKIRSKYETNEQYYLTNDQIREKLGLKKHKNKDIFISSETFSMITNEKDIERLKHIFKDHEVVVVVYIRNILERLESGYGESIKGYRAKSTKSFESFHNLKKINRKDFLVHRKKMIERWEKIFGEDKVIVRPYVKKALIDGDVIADFLNVVGLERIDLKNKAFKSLEKKKQNINPSGFRMQIIRYLNSSNCFNNLRINQRKNYIYRIATNKKIKDPPGVNSYFSRNYAENLMAKYEKEELELAEKYFPSCKKNFLSLDNRTYISDLSKIKRKTILAKAWLWARFYSLDLCISRRWKN